jgi:hypothetical protein
MSSQSEKHQQKKAVEFGEKNGIKTKISEKKTFTLQAFK